MRNAYVGVLVRVQAQLAAGTGLSPNAHAYPHHGHYRPCSTAYQSKELTRSLQAVAENQKATYKRREGVLHYQVQDRPRVRA